MKKEIKRAIVFILCGLGLITMGLFTNYTLVIARIAIPSWLTIAVGVILIIGWFILSMLPDRYDEDGNPLKNGKDK